MSAPGARGRLLLRELESDEPSRAHVPFDESTLSALRRVTEQWRASGRPVAVGPAAMHRFTAVPGLS